MKYSYKKIVIASALLILTLIYDKDVYAVTSSPEFSTCTNPQGSLKVHYQSGIHAIVGDQTLYNGSDRVYNLDGENYLQCLCLDSGAGIQTDWWKIGYMSENEIDSYVKLGWIFVPNGSDWGLIDAPYLAKNTDYRCDNTSPSSTPSPTPTTSTNVGGAITETAASTSDDSVLSLAGVGTSREIIFYLVSGVILIKFGNRLLKY